MTSVGDVTAFFNGVRDHSAQQAAGPDGVIVAGNREINNVRIAVGIQYCNNWDAQFVCFGNRNVFFHGVQNEDGVGEPFHVANAAQVAFKFFQLARKHQRFFFDHGFEFAGAAHALVLLHFCHPLRDGLEVGQHATQPTLVNVRHTAFFGVGPNGVLCLTLGAYKKDPAAVSYQVAGKPVGLFDALQTLLEVNDVNP